MAEKTKSFDFVMGLGQSCEVAYQIKRKGLRKAAGPFDWFVTPSLPLIELLQNDFDGFMEKDNLEIVGHRGKRYVVKDQRYGVRSYHDFVVTDCDSDRLGEYRDFKAKMSRRIRGFYDRISSRESILFVRVLSTKNECIDLFEILKKKRPGKKTELLAIHKTDDFDDDWHIQGIHPRKIRFPDGNGPDEWKGYDEEWDRALHGIRLANPDLGQLVDRVSTSQFFEDNVVGVLKKVKKKIKRA